MQEQEEEKEKLDLDILICKTLIQRLSSNNEKMKFLGVEMDKDITVHTKELFEKHFKNDKFDEADQIGPFFTTEFLEKQKESVLQFLVERIKANLGDFESPEFILIHFYEGMKAFSEKTLLSEFVLKFCLPKEEKWDTYLLENMPEYKESSKKPEGRKVSFDTNHKPIPSLLIDCLAILRSLPIDQYST